MFLSPILTPEEPAAKALHAYLCKVREAEMRARAQKPDRFERLYRSLPLTTLRATKPAPAKPKPENKAGYPTIWLKTIDLQLKSGMSHDLYENKLLKKRPRGISHYVVDN